jgi:hypothetical protein
MAQGASVYSLKECCFTIKTAPPFTDILLDGLRTWFDSQKIDPLEYPEMYCILIQQQRTKGWIQLFQGRLLIMWAQFQQDHYKGLPLLKVETARCGQGISFSIYSGIGTSSGKHRIKIDTAKTPKLNTLPNVIRLCVNSISFRSGLNNAFFWLDPTLRLPEKLDVTILR